MPPLLDPMTADSTGARPPRRGLGSCPRPAAPAGPTSRVYARSGGAALLASPQSATLTRPDPGSMSTLAGFTSRCSTQRAWAWARPDSSWYSTDCWGRRGGRKTRLVALAPQAWHASSRLGAHLQAPAPLGPACRHGTAMHTLGGRAEGCSRPSAQAADGVHLDGRQLPSSWVDIQVRPKVPPHCLENQHQSAAVPQHVQQPGGRRGGAWGWGLEFWGFSGRGGGVVGWWWWWWANVTQLLTARAWAAPYRRADQVCGSLNVGS